MATSVYCKAPPPPWQLSTLIRSCRSAGFEPPPCYLPSQEGVSTRGKEVWYA